ncbi:uncharacterized protein LOC110113959 [Dendrobium catenatum]|uniref:uncharacterized protein LOC110113959 n=1 Tax=Dendrobium catenatum TaxID=906689 RepID=UPI0009F611DC|nr:uncharacterized protein LOC110113959 [Dendrobium catenatum]
MESALSNGPWYVNGNIIGLDKWSPTFQPSSLKGLIAPIWIRLPNLPLQSWDKINVSRIASKIGTPCLIDENMFQWGKGEFGRVCVRIKLEEKLPMGIWVEGSSGKFYQRIEYKKIPTICFNCCRIGHLGKNCYENSVKAIPIAPNNNAGLSHTTNVKQKDDSKVENESEGYGPWIQIKYGKKNFWNDKSKYTWTRPLPRKENKIVEGEISMKSNDKNGHSAARVKIEDKISEARTEEQILADQVDLSQ